QPMSPLEPVVGRPSDGEIATRSALGARNPYVVYVEVDERIGLPSFAADVDGPSDGGSARGLEDRGPARVEAGIPQQLGGRSGSIGQADFDREIVRPGMVDLHRDPGPLDKAFNGRRMDVDCGRPGGRNRR